VDALFVFVLRFEHRAAVERAFGLLYNETAVETCTIEPEELGIRFVATKAGGAPLLERVHESGGLVWCKQYPMDADGGGPRAS